MKKPRLYKKIQSPFGGLVSVRVFNTNDGIHAAMREYARAISSTPENCIVTLKYYEGEDLEIDLCREEKVFTYKDYEGEVYEETYLGPRWDLDGAPSTSPVKLIEKASWYKPECIKSITKVL